MSEKISGVCKVWRGEYGFLLADDGRAVFLHYRECERCALRCGTFQRRARRIGRGGGGLTGSPSAGGVC